MGNTMHKLKVYATRQAFLITRLVLLLCFYTATGICQTPQPTATLHGTVANAENGQPIP